MLPEPVINAVPLIARVSLEKRFEDKAPALVSLAKKASVSLQKHQLGNVKAKTAFVLDASGSMTGQYHSGQVQRTLDRVFPLGVHFDDDETLETWAFAHQSKKMSNISFDNHASYVKSENKGWKQWMKELNCAYNNEPAVIRDVITHFTGLTPPAFEQEKRSFWGSSKTPASSQANQWAPAISSKTPVLILFISDGGVSQDDHIAFLLKWSSTLPIFWQFIGIGGSSYGALETLDNLTGRCVDNANFFAIDDLESISESELYDRMIGEFPQWLKLAHAKSMIDDYRV